MINLKEKQKIDQIFGGLLLLLLRLPVLLLGSLLKRDHSPGITGDILFIKMQGGGSLVLAYPSILSIKEVYKDSRIVLLATPSTATFGETLNVFDEIICVNDTNIISLLFSSAYALWRCFRIDTVIDLEVYS